MGKATLTRVAFRYAIHFRGIMDKRGWWGKL